MSYYAYLEPTLRDSSTVEVVRVKFRFMRREGLSRVFPILLSYFYRSNTYRISSPMSRFASNMFFHTAKGNVVTAILFRAAFSISSRSFHVNESNITLLHCLLMDFDRNISYFYENSSKLFFLKFRSCLGRLGRSQQRRYHEHLGT